MMIALPKMYGVMGVIVSDSIFDMKGVMVNMNTHSRCGGEVGAFHFALHDT